MPFIDLPDRIPGLHMRDRSDKPWYQFRNLAADEAELFLYDEIGGWGTLAEDFIAELKAITTPKLRVRVSSPGGSVFEGIALANALRAHPATVTVQVDGIAASIASVIAMAGDRVVVQPQAMLMCHDAAGVCLGNAQDMNDMAALLDKISGNIADAYAEKAGGTREEWRTRMRAESWFTAEEAVEVGLADEMLPARKPQTAPAEAEPAMRQFDLTAYGYQGPKQPEAPKPGPPPAAPSPPSQTPASVASEPTLTEDIRSLIGEEVAAQLRASVQPEPAPAPEPVVELTITAPTADGEPAAEAAPERPVEIEPEPAAVEPEPVAPAVEPEPPAEEPDAWAAAVAHLTQPKPDPWAAAFSHLVNPRPSSSAATAA